MKREQSIVGKYYRLSPRDRLDKIYANFDCFPGIIADYEYEMAEWMRDLVDRTVKTIEGMSEGEFRTAYMGAVTV